jgi:NADH-quinone oxidoreductase subunit J
VGSIVERALFLSFAALSVASALGVVFLRDPIKSALSLIVCFFGLASLFVLLHAELLGVLEVLVYAGAIMVLFVFVLMLVEDKNAPLFSAAIGQKVTLPVKAGGVLAIGGALVYVVATTRFDPPAEVAPGFGGPRAVGLHFFERFVFHFEMSSVLLLAAIVGAVVVSRRSKIRGE